MNNLKIRIVRERFSLIVIILIKTMLFDVPDLYSQGNLGLSKTCNDCYGSVTINLSEVYAASSNVNVSIKNSGNTVVFTDVISVNQGNNNILLGASLTCGSSYTIDIDNIPAQNGTRSHTLGFTMSDPQFSPGIIEDSDEYFCQNPNPIGNAESASTSCGSIQYSWYKSTDNQNFTEISGATGATYDPPLMTTPVQTWYKRKASSVSTARNNILASGPFSNTVVRTPVEQVDPGSISGGGTLCQGEIDGPISSTEAASVSHGPVTVEYQWQVSFDNGNFANVSSGGKSATYTPNIVTEVDDPGTVKYRRGARNSACSSYSYVYSNTITYEVQANYTHGGTISLNESVGTYTHCGTLSGSITFESESIPGDADDNIYLWQKKAISAVQWSNLGGNGDELVYSQDIEETTTFRRRVRNQNCSATNWKETTITVKIINDITNAGTLTMDQSNCGPFDPEDLDGTRPSGGAGETVSYQWYYDDDIDPPTFSQFRKLLGKTGEDLSLGQHTESMAYLRQAWVVGCDNKQSSDWIIIEVNTPTDFTYTTNNVDCNGGEDGAIAVSTTSGIGPFDFDWNGPTNVGNIPNPTDLEAGTYALTVTSDEGCTKTASINITEPNPLHADLTPTHQMHPGANDGSFLFDDFSGGTESPQGGGRYKVIYDGITTSNVSQLEVSNLYPGQYDITLLDYKGCTKDYSVTINEKICSLAVNSIVTEALCFGDGASVSLAVTGGEPSEPIAYDWSHSDINTASFNNLNPNVYNVVVSDGFCSDSTTIIIKQPPQLTLNFLSAETQVTNPYEVLGGTAPYYVEWIHRQPIHKIEQGTICDDPPLQVIDANGCVAIIECSN